MAELTIGDLLDEISHLPRDTPVRIAVFGYRTSSEHPVRCVLDVPPPDPQTDPDTGQVHPELDDNSAPYDWASRTPYPRRVYLVEGHHLGYAPGHVHRANEEYGA